MLTTVDSSRSIPCWDCLKPAQEAIDGHPYALTASQMACRRGRATWLARGISPHGLLTPATEVRPGELRPHKDVSYPLLAPEENYFCVWPLLGVLPPLSLGCRLTAERCAATP